MVCSLPAVPVKAVSSPSIVLEFCNLMAEPKSPSLTWPSEDKNTLAPRRKKGKREEERVRGGAGSGDEEKGEENDEDEQEDREGGARGGRGEMEKK